MALTLSQNLKMSQNLVITPQLQQAIKLLQMSHVELLEVVQQEMLENPLLEEGAEVEALPKGDAEIVADQQELDGDVIPINQAAANSEQEIGGVAGDLTQEPKDFDWENYLNTYNNSYTGNETLFKESDENNFNYEATTGSATTLFEHLTWQLHLAGLTEAEMEIVAEIIGNIGDDGYLNASLDEIFNQLDHEFEMEDIEEILKIIQRFDPIGVGSRSLQECLLVQIEALDQDRELLKDIVVNFMHELEKRDYVRIAKGIKVSPNKVKGLIKIIHGLEPKPGRAFTPSDAQYITPDVYAKKVGNEWVITLNEDGLPRLQVSNYYKNVVGAGKSDAKEYVQTKLKSAVWLIRSIQQRQRTLYKTTKSIVKLQRDFFERGIAHLKPMTIKDIAAEIEMHESTVSRVTTNKYVHTPHGIFELKFFFSSGLSTTDGNQVASESIKDKIKHMVASEDRKNPLSDQDIVELLKKENTIIARRTVAKYREMLGILPSSQRRHLY